MTMGRLLAAAGGAAGIYFGVVGLDVFNASRGEQALLTEVATQMSQAAAAQKAAAREEGAVAGFQETIQQHEQSVQTVDAEIGVVQQRLVELQQLREARLVQVADAQAALEEARAKLAKLLSESKRHKDAATAAQQALTQAHQHTLEAKQGIHPLQHPLVRPFIGRS